MISLATSFSSMLSYDMPSKRIDVLRSFTGLVSDSVYEEVEARCRGFEKKRLLGKTGRIGGGWRHQSYP